QNAVWESWKAVLRKLYGKALFGKAGSMDKLMYGIS
ncbi:hypothetical protein Tco_0912473, partial [Tanacetum coccineum]